ncbi:hypothetical protein ElyMa_002293600 [Elysia marginata]|uniref:Uncharacterized protein n=1 Tax=Elysia marginata TaxID=1093978 RepID=A0AAV4G1W0_9GAST|nr:hypothetical protein ElyMa_002293600 [Elysia marginata]
MPINRPAVRLGAGRAGGVAGGAVADQHQQQQQQQQQQAAAAAAGVGRRQTGPAVTVRPGSQGLRSAEMNSPSPGPSPAGSLNNLALPRGGGTRAADQADRDEPDDETESKQIPDETPFQQTARNTVS